MKESQEKPPNALTILREKAEAKIAQEKIANKTISAEQDELLIHQLELRMQNEQLRVAQLALEESRDLYLNLYEYAPVGYLTVNEDGRIVEANLKAANLLGINREALLNHFFSKFILQDDEALWYLTFKRNKLLAPNESYVLELRLPHANGETLDVRLNALRMADNVKHHLFRFTLIDITKEKKAEQERLLHEANLRKALVREVHHRIKNNLQGVLSLMEHYAMKHPELIDGMNAAISQLQSIAVVHGLKSDDSNCDLMLQSILSSIANYNETLLHRPVNFDMSNKPVWTIKEEESVPIALVINELLFNAIKHSPINSPITLSLETDHAEKTVLISITNQGQLNTDAKHTNRPILGTGLTLATALLPKTGADLNWQQKGELVVAKLGLAYPIILQS
jgi:PAS domain S-box-containing protein